MKKVRVREITGESREMYFVEDREYKEHFTHGKKFWLFGEHNYTENGVLFAERIDAEMYEFLRAKAGKVLIHRLEVMFAEK